MIKPLPIRARLSLWYFVMFASAAFLLSATNWWMLHRSVDATEYHELQERADDVRVLLDHQGPNPSLAELQEQIVSIYQFKDDGKWLQVRDQDGNWIYRSQRMIAENPDLPLPNQLPARGVTAKFRQGTRYVLVLAYPVQAQGHPYSVQTGVALNQSMLLLRSFREDLFLLTPALIVLAGLAGHFMSRKVLQPVAALTAEARHINDRNLATRLPVTLADDEISDLASTLNQMLERIDRAFASVRAFTGNASHELRTPLSFLRAEIELALYRPRDAEEYRATLRQLLEETVRMSNLVEQLLALARTDAGAEPVSMTQIKVGELLQRTEQTWKQSANLAMLDFTSQAPNDDLFVLGDQASIERMLSILVENAIRYTPPGGALILRAAPAGNRVEFAVSDTGVGISAEDKPRIFERFYRVAQPDSLAPRGSGLGLALGKWIAERHGTQLAVESSVGRGSRFSFSLERVAEGDASQRPSSRTSLAVARLSGD